MITFILGLAVGLTIPWWKENLKRLQMRSWYYTYQDESGEWFDRMVDTKQEAVESGCKYGRRRWIALTGPFWINWIATKLGV